MNWIAIKDRPIPKDGIPVLVYLEKELGKTRIHPARYLPNVGMIANLFEFDAPKPTHWMPMIEGPTESNSAPVDTIINHEEAEQLAHLKKSESNLARCYLDHLDKIRTWIDVESRPHVNNL